MKKIVNTEKAPSPIGPYSQAVIAGNMLFISGQICIIPSSGELMMADIKSETVQVMKNLEQILVAAGSAFDKVVKTTIFLKRMSDFAVVNEVYGSFFQSDFPARETVEVSMLPKDVNVEISMVALVKDNSQPV